MKIIPVIDLLNGMVVHAKKGDRANYQAITSKLTHSNKPLDIVSALLDIFPFKALYIADLNSIQKTPAHIQDNFDIVCDIASRFPHLALWVDAGFDTIATLDKWRQPNIKPILGSENFTQLHHYQSIVEMIQKPYCLSLDFMQDGFKGDIKILNQHQAWPQEIIAMTLSNVGSNLGPNIEILSNIRKKTQSSTIIAAGGVRHLEDLIHLKHNSIDGALIATALHQKQITTMDLNSLDKIKA